MDLTGTKQSIQKDMFIEHAKYIGGELNSAAYWFNENKVAQSIFFELGRRYTEYQHLGDMFQLRTEINNCFVEQSKSSQSS